MLSARWRWLVLVCALGCKSSSRSSAPAPAVSAPDPFDPLVNCGLYRERAKTTLTAVQKLVAGSAAMSPEQLGDAARALDKQRVTLGPAPFHARALEHHGAVLTTFDGLSVSLQGVAALRGDGPKSPELQHAEPDLQKNLRALDAEVKALDTLCAK